MKRICHLTSVHPRYDTRIFIKECQSLQKAGFDVSLIVADNAGDESKNDINIYDIGKENSRFKRMRLSPRKVYRKALEIDSDIYHFHDPELITVGSKLIKKGKIVIYDVHEDVPKQILTKPYLNRFFKFIFSKFFEIFENNRSKKFSYILSSTDFIKERFLKVNSNTKSIKNYPIINEFDHDTNWENKDNTACYLGSVSKLRGIVEIIDAFDKIDFKLELAGKFFNKNLEEKVKEMPGWRKVNEYGFVSRIKAKEILEKTKVGLVTLHPTINYKDALPVKMFEYMLSGIPVIASDIPLWREIIEKHNCGLLVDPLNSNEIADSISDLINNNSIAEEMGKNGKNAVLQEYNWTNEALKLINIYKIL